ncbi:hypothetical protein G4B88_026556 [Cannabis sativa]|uniref:Kinesin motor domain-containing protein n=1 Tax=Cannabis sativa TaxID=3483 RepID=A0A7J6GQS6_CANSA|nr:hypothetical protein G4B88_026556 [Cannabis sativa]
MMKGEALVEKGANSDEEESIVVSVRVRPLNEKELARNEECDWECISNNTVAIKNNLSERITFPTAYTFDRVFGFDCTTKQVYDEGAKEVILSVLKGINSTLFAYGQTSSGKTYTMNGVTKYAIADVYDYIEMHKEREFVLKFSAMEIYNEIKGTVVEKLTEEILRDQTHLKELLSICEVESSASEFQQARHSNALTASANFVDLAGSERVSQTLSVGTRLKEGSHINRSLLTLGTVIRKLSKGRNGHVPYRDSKLTRILQNSLGGNARTAIICTLSPARSHVEQSRNTLFFASCAKEVTTNAKINVVVSDKALVKQLQRELAKMESELKTLQSTPDSHDSTVLLKQNELLIEKMDEEIKELRKQRDFAESRIESMLQSKGSNSESQTRNEEVLSKQNKLHPLLTIPEDKSAENSVVNEENELNEEEKVSYIVTDNCSYDALQQKVQELQKTINSLVNYYPSEDSPCSSEACMSSSRSVMLTRSRSCKAVLTTTSPSFVGLNEEEEHNEKESPSPAQNFWWNSHKSVRSANFAKLSRKDSNNFSLSFSLDNVDDIVERKSQHGRGKGIKRSSNSSRHTRRLIRNDSNASILSASFEPDEFDEEESDENESRERENEIKQHNASRLNLAHHHNNKKLIRNDSNASSCLSSSLETNQTKEIHLRREKGLREKLLRSKFGTKTSKISKRHSRASVLSAPATRNHSKESDSEESVLNFMQEELENQQEQEEEETIKHINAEPLITWPLEFEKRRQEIIELWDLCYVPLTHRSYFFLIYKGERSDSVYLEVELRRLHFLKDTFTTKSSNVKKDTQILTRASSLKMLNREREMLSKQVHKKFPRKDRESLYQKWGIKLKSKQRSLQLAKCLWTNTNDNEHLKQSALLVAKLVGIAEPNQVPKEIFGLSFLSQPINFSPY